MRKHTKKSLARTSMIDVIFGVVIAYGFMFFDKAATTTDYIRLVLVYAIIIFDWVYVSLPYDGREYKHNSFFLLDIVTLFVISRLLCTSIGDNPYYWLWMAGLFTLYAGWDTMAKKERLEPKYNYNWSIAGDLFTAIAFFVSFLLLKNGIFQDGLLYTLAMLPIYIVVLIAWNK